VKFMITNRNNTKKRTEIKSNAVMIYDGIQPVMFLGERSFSLHITGIMGSIYICYLFCIKAKL
jgi:hypothetical protein